jgi:hypothetical protein
LFISVVIFTYDDFYVIIEGMENELRRVMRDMINQNKTRVNPLSGVVYKLINDKAEETAKELKRGRRGSKGEPGVSIKGDPGEKGEKGDIPKHEWSTTKLRFEKPDGTWGEWVDLKSTLVNNSKQGYHGGGASRFLQLQDVPSTFTGQGGKGVRVNSGATALEFYTLPAGSGTVTSVSVVTANGVSGSVATETTTPAITLTLGAITPTSVNALTLAAQTNGFTIAGGTTSKTLTVPLDASVSGTNTGDNAANSSSTYIGTTAVALNRTSAALTLAGITLTTPNIGTPSAGTLTNCTGLPIACLVASTSTALGVGSIELGHASDATIARVSAGVISVEGVTIPTISSTSTLTNKRITQRVVTTADDSTAVIDVDVTDQYQLTAMANATTISTTGTPTAGQKLIIRLKDDGTARGLTWDGVFRAIGVTLPTTTVISQTVYIGCIYNATDTKWDAVAVAQEA